MSGAQRLKNGQMRYVLFIELFGNDGFLCKKTLRVCEKTFRLLEMFVTLYRCSPFLCKVFLRCLILFIKKHYQ